MKEVYFNTKDAVRYGVSGAVILYFFAIKTTIGHVEGEKGTVWLRFSLKALAEQFPYMTIEQIRTTIDNLVKKGAIVKKRVGNKPYDRTMSYALTEEYFKED